MLHKPRGYITTMKDEQGRRCVADLLTGLRARAVPVGRLDRNSEGLLLLTDDGELLYRLTHPAHEVEKCYLVTLRGAVEDSLIEALGGELFLDGEKLKPVGVRLLKREPEKTVMCIRDRPAPAQDGEPLLQRTLQDAGGPEEEKGSV